MPPFLSLPPEIRLKIYRQLRSFKSPLINAPLITLLLINSPLINSLLIDSPDRSNSYPLGYCSFGFHSRILETNRQICHEAKEVFYGENSWTFFASQWIFFDSSIFRTKPMVLILPFIRKAHIRLGMLACFLSGRTESRCEQAIDTNVKEVCQVLLTAPALRTVKIFWTETGIWPSSSYMESDSIRSLISEILRPLVALPTISDLQKSTITVAGSQGERYSEMELDFSDCVDQVIALHRSRKAVRGLQTQSPNHGSD